MKTRTQIFAALLLTVLSTAAFASDKEKETTKTSAKVEVKRQDAHVFNLVYKGANAEKVQIRLLDANGEVVFSEIIKKIDAFVRPYNLKALPEGIYTVEVTDANGTTTKTINHTDKIEMMTAVELPTIVKLDSIENAKYKLTIVNKGYSNAEVKIYDNQDKLVYNGLENINGSYAKLYNLKKVVAKKVVVTINDQTKVFEL